MTNGVVRPYRLYSDFNCPFCYALHERLHALQLLDRCEWRGVQHAPHLPRPMKAWTGSLGAELRHEVAAVQRLAPDLPIAVPSGKPNTRSALIRASRLFAHDRQIGMRFIRSAYRSVWCEGLDLSDPAVLDRLQPVTRDEDAVGETLTEWENAWRATGETAVPLLVGPDHVLSVGVAREEELLRLFSF